MRPKELKSLESFDTLERGEININETPIEWELGIVGIEYPNMSLTLKLKESSHKWFSYSLSDKFLGWSPNFSLAEPS
jgi:hypothetical protein